MRILFNLFVLFFFMCGVCFSKEVNFIHITDIDLNTKNAYKLQETIKEINSYPDIDFVVFGGNNIEKPNFQNLDTFLYLTKKVNKKCYVLLGSSDVSSKNGITKDYYLKRVRRALFFRHNKKPNYVFEKKGYVFIAMDGSKQYFQSSNGYYGKEELAWLEKQLKKYNNKNIIILQHFPLLETKSKWIETPKKEEYLQLLSKYKNVKMIVSGHYGNNYETENDGIYHIITESYSKNSAYKIIKIDSEDDFIGTYLIK